MENLKGRGHLGDLRVDEGICKMHLKEIECGLNAFRSGFM
jgi:hypothetical protein